MIGKEAPQVEEPIEKEHLVFPDCQHCKKTGWLKVVLVEWKNENGHKKLSIYNPRSAGQFNYLTENGNFKASADLLPCICENGDHQNVKNGEEWIKQGMRHTILERSFRYEEDALEDFEQVAMVDYLNDIAAGRPAHKLRFDEVEPKAKEIREYYANIKESK